MPGNPTDIVGKQFGRLTVRMWLGSDQHRHSRYYADCECGTKDFMVRRPDLIAGRTRSCGCLRRETSSQSPWNFKNDPVLRARVHEIQRELRKKAKFSLKTPQVDLQ